MDIHSEILRELYSNEDIYANFRAKETDDGYPHTNIEDKCVEVVLKETKTNFWLEVGSMVGGSAIKTAAYIKNNGFDCRVICIDPFCGDVNMWEWERELTLANGWRFLNMRNGTPTIRQRFMSNVCRSKMESQICPITATGVVGMKLIERLFEKNRISQKPGIIYLDSAHEKDETFIEISVAWSILNHGGILFGDDWFWEAVQNDALKSAMNFDIDTNKALRIQEHLENECFIQNGIVVWKNKHWFMCKK